jgi:hypothetical protein
MRVIAAAIAVKCCFFLLHGEERSQASEPTPFSVASVLTHKDALDRPHDIKLQGNIAFVPGKGGSLAIIDVTDPKSPRIIWHQRQPIELNDAETVLPLGDRLFLGTNDFHSIDISNPRKPVFQSRISDRKQIARINGMVRRDQWIFAASKHGWLDAFDISDPKQPAVAGAADIKSRFGVSSPHDVDLFRNHAVVPDPAGFDRSKKAGKLALLGVFDTRTKQLLPAEKWTLTGIVVSKELAGANRVQVLGNHAFVGASTRAGSGMFVVVDLSDPSSPRQVASLPFAANDGWGPNGLTVAGNVVFLAGGQSVEAIDIREPTRPKKLASQSFPKELPNANPRYKGGGDSGHDLVYRDGYLYVTGQNDHCLLVLQVGSKQIRDLAQKAR